MIDGFTGFHDGTDPNGGPGGEPPDVPDTLCYVCPRCGERWQATSDDECRDVCPECGEIGIEED